MVCKNAGTHTKERIFGNLYLSTITHQMECKTQNTHRNIIVVEGNQNQNSTPSDHGVRRDCKR